MNKKKILCMTILLVHIHSLDAVFMVMTLFNMFWNMENNFGISIKMKINFYTLSSWMLMKAVMKL